MPLVGLDQNCTTLFTFTQNTPSFVNAHVVVALSPLSIHIIIPVCIILG